MLGFTFLFPAVLWAATAVSAPVIIHLIMRTKPRRIIFPALRFVRKTHQASYSKQILKHILLLLLRMAIIAAIAVLVARWIIPTWHSAVVPSKPVSAVFVIDNSGSMDAGVAGQSLLAKGKAIACQVVDSLPEGSKMAVIETASQSATVSFLQGKKEIIQQIADTSAGFGNASVSAALTQAVGLLAKSDTSPKEIYLVTDMTRSAWRDGFQLTTDDVNVMVVDCHIPQDTNVALGEVKIDPPIVPVGGDVQLVTTISSKHVGGDMHIQAELDGQVVGEQTVAPLPGQLASVEMMLRPQHEGVVSGRLVLQHPDELEMDNVRYFTLSVGPPPRVLIISDKTTDDTYNLLSNAIGAMSRPRVKAELVASDSFEGKQLAGVRAAVLTDVASLVDSQWQALEKFVREGGQLWVAAGPALTAGAYNSPAAQKIMPVALRSMEEIHNGVAMKAPQGNEPMLEPFTTTENAPLTDVLCRGRVAIQSIAADAHVVLRYQDEAAAIITRQVGDGTVLFWDFSLAPQHFSRTSLAQFAVLAQRAMRLLVTDPSLQASYTWGQEALIPLPKECRNPVVTVAKPAAPGSKAVEVPVIPDFRRGVVPLQLDRLGQWVMTFSEDNRRIQRAFSVNAPPAESDLTPADLGKVKTMFPPGRMTITTSLADVVHQQQTVVNSLDLAVPIVLVLLALMIAEAFFANRFYRQTSP